MIDVIFKEIKSFRYIILSDFYLCKNDCFKSYQLKGYSKRSYFYDFQIQTKLHH